MSLTPRTGEDSQIRRAGTHRGLAGRGALLLVLLIGVLLIALRPSGPPGPPPPARNWAAPAGDPLTYRPAAAAGLSARAASGSAQVLFVMSPGGAIATAARVARFRPLIHAAVRGTDIPPSLLEGLVFLESAGRPSAMVDGDPANATGLTQILPGTGQSLLGMHVNLARSQALTAAIGSAQAAGHTARASRLETQRAAIDQRFDPAAALAGTVRYLEIAEHDLGRLDLAVAAYHAGIGNIQQVLYDYDGGRTVSYPQLYFDTAPDLHAAAWRLLSSLGDDSSLYWWRVLEAETIMRLSRTDPSTLRRLTHLELSYPSTALVLVPPGTVTRFSNAAALSQAYADGKLVPLPRNAAALHLSYAATIGALARRLGAPAALYRGLRPSAVHVLIAMAAIVHRIAPGSAPLTLASAVVDNRYERRLGFADPAAATGYTFQIERRYNSGAEAQALQFALDRLQALNLIGWIRGSNTIEVTAAPDAGQVLEHGL